MVEKQTALWKRILGYAAFAIIALIITFFLTFPYDALKDRIRTEAEAQGLVVNIGSLGPGFFALRAKNVELSKKSSTEVPNEALLIDSLSVGPTLFPPGLGVRANAFGGSIAVKVAGLSGNHIKVDIDDLDMSKGNIKGYSGIDFSGTIDAHVDLTIPTSAAVGTGPAEPDLTQANGNLSLETRGLTINGGTATLAIPQFGPEPTPLDLPKIVMGDINGKLKFEKGLGTISEFSGKSPDLEVQITGTLKLAGRLLGGQLRGAEYSEPNMEIRFKPDPEFQKRLGLIGSALSMVGSDPKDPTWRKGNLTGYLGRPKFP